MKRPPVDLSLHRTALRRVERRLLLRGGLSVGALTMLSGCNLQDNDTADKVLWAMSRWNDKVQAWLFRESRLAPTYAASAVTNPFPYNGFYPVDDAPELSADDWALEVSGLVQDKTPWGVDRLRTLPQAAQTTRLICIEGWSAIGTWSGVPLQVFLQRIGADLRARYISITCADRYYSSIDMETALHPQTILALDFGHRALPTPYGFPLRLRMPTKLGFKNAKFITSLSVTNTYPGGYWEDQGYNWFSGS